MFIKKYFHVFLGILVILAGITYFVFSISQILNQDKYSNYMVSSSTKIIHLEKAGKYKVYIEKGASFEGVYYYDNEIDGAFQITIIDNDTNDEIDLKTPNYSETYSIGTREGKLLNYFEISKPTTIKVTVDSDHDYLLNIRSNSLVQTVLVGVLIFFVSIVLGIMIIILPFFRKPKKPKREKNSKWEPSY